MVCQPLFVIYCLDEENINTPCLYRNYSCLHDSRFKKTDAGSQDSGTA